MRKFLYAIGMVLVALVATILVLPEGSFTGPKTLSKKTELVEHTKFSESLAPRVGKRVQINVRETISESECRKLVLYYRSEAMPDGQTSVHMPSKILEGRLTPFCFDNIDSKGIIFNHIPFKETN